MFIRYSLITCFKKSVGIAVFKNSKKEIQALQWWFKTNENDYSHERYGGKRKMQQMLCKLQKTDRLTPSLWKGNWLWDRFYESEF